MYNHGMIVDEKLLLMAEPDKSTVEIDLKSETDKLSAVIEWRQNKELLLINGYGFVDGVPIDRLGESLPSFLKLKAMECDPNPGLVVQLWDMSEGKLSREQVSALICHETFNRMASGKDAENGYRMKALVNPAAINVVKDRGTYREIHLKEEFQGSTFFTLMTKPEIQTYIDHSLSGPA